MRLRRAVLLSCLAALACSRCAPPEDPDRTRPAGVAVGLFRLAGDPDAAAGKLEKLLDPALLDRDRAAALDSVAGLRVVERPEVIGEVALDAVGRVAVDLEGRLPGVGVARFEVQTERDADECWRVVSILGPGVAWPARPRPRDEGLSTSLPPEERGRPARGAAGL